MSAGGAPVAGRAVVVRVAGVVAVAVASAVAVGGAACGGGGSGAGEAGGGAPGVCDPAELAGARLELGTTDQTLRGWTPLSSGDDVELVLGFQGLNFLPIALRVFGFDTTGARLRMGFTDEASGATIAQGTRTSPRFEAQGGGVQLDRALPIAFLDVGFCEAVGLRGSVTVTVSRAGDGCRVKGTASALHVRDAVKCVDFCGDLFPPTADGGTVQVARYPECDGVPVELTRCAAAADGGDPCAF